VLPLLAAMAVVVWLPATGSAGSARLSMLSIDPVHADFSDPDRATTYSVPNVKDDAVGAKLSYQWTLTLENVDDTKEVDTGCTNHGALTGTDATFVWHHGNAGDPVHDDGCNHDLQGKWGHQGLLSVTVSDDKGWQCSATYKGTFSSAENATIGQNAASEPDCTGTPVAPPPPPPLPCRCLRLEARIVPSSIAFVNPGETGGMHMELTVAWTMACTRGTGGCAGKFDLLPPQPALALRAKLSPNLGRINCNGACGKTLTGSKAFVLTAGPKFGGERRGRTVKSMKLRMHRECQGKKTTDRIFTVVFDPRTALVDKKKSDLNANGIADGKKGG
jgi:hypothetical protein